MDFLSNERNMKDRELIKRTFKYIKPHLPKFIISLIFMLVNVALEILLPIIVSSSIGEMKKGADSISLVILLTLAGTYIVLGVINVFFIYFQSLIMQNVGKTIVLKLREDVFNHIEGLSISQFNNVPVGKLVSRVSNDTVALSDLFSSTIVKLMKNILLIAGTYVVMFFVSFKMTLFVSIFVILTAIISVIFRLISRKIFAKEREEISLMNSFISENITGMKITQVFNQEDRKINEFNKRNKSLSKSTYNVLLAFASYRPLISFIYVLAVACCFAIGIPLVEEGGIGAEKFFLFYIFVGQLFGPVQELAEQLNGLQRGLTSAERIYKILDVKPVVLDKEDAIDIDGFKGEIIFDHVWFAYTNENWILKDVSFKIDAGETAAFVGKTGAGKTTILSLIVRNYDIQKGHIYIDGIDIKNIKLTSLRKHIGQMLQDVFLFTGTINSNIRLRDDTISEDRIKEVCKYVNADRFIENLPNKYEEEIKENGSNLSTGERQLLSFARVIARSPSIMILDEATANIDTETEVLIQESLEKMKSIGTMLIVAHRLSTVRNADKIIVLEDGEIIENGTHDELISIDGYYKTLCDAAENY